jgi:predicted amidohydrolase YtcJ
MPILPKIAPFLASPAAFKKGLEYTETYYHRNGITLACEPGGFPSKPIQDAINAVHSDDATPFNHCFMADGKTLAANNPRDPKAMLAAAEEVLDWGKGRTWYLPKQVKFLTDGAIYSQLMMMKDGYTDGHHGAWIMDPPVFAYAFQAFWDAGYQIHVHNNGDGGMDVLLGELEKAMARNPRKDHRTVLVHFGFAQPQQVARWIELGGIVSSNPYYVTALAGRYAKLGVGPERSANMVPHADVLRAKGSLSFHSDMPMAPAKPLQLVWAAVNRLTAEGDVSGPQHKVPLDIALRAITIDAAFSIQQEKKVGSVEVGKHANLTILDKSPYDVAPTAIKDIGVWGTMLEGRVQPVPAAPKASSARDGASATADWPFEVPAAGFRRDTADARRDHPGDGCDMARALAAAMTANASPAGDRQLGEGPQSSRNEGRKAGK